MNNAINLTETASTNAKVGGITRVKPNTETASTSANEIKVIGTNNNARVILSDFGKALVKAGMTKDTFTMPKLTRFLDCGGDRDDWDTFENQLAILRQLAIGAHKANTERETLNADTGKKAYAEQTKVYKQLREVVSMLGEKWVTVSGTDRKAKNIITIDYNQNQTVMMFLASNRMGEYVSTDVFRQKLVPALFMLMQGKTWTEVTEEVTKQRKADSAAKAEERKAKAEAKKQEEIDNAVKAKTADYIQIIDKLEAEKADGKELYNKMLANIIALEKQVKDMGGTPVARNF